MTNPTPANKNPTQGSGVSETDVPSLRATAGQLDTLVAEVQEQRKTYKGLLRDVSAAAAENTVNGQPGGIYQPPLDALGSTCGHIDKQLRNLEDSLANTAKVMRQHADMTEHGEKQAAQRFTDA
jgi:hypothetical protein